jgi:hypothetical protein
MKWRRRRPTRYVETMPGQFTPTGECTDEELLLAASIGFRGIILRVREQLAILERDGRYEEADQLRAETRDWRRLALLLAEYADLRREDL